MDRTELTRIGAALRRQYEVAKQAPLTPSMLALLVAIARTRGCEGSASRLAR